MKRLALQIVAVIGGLIGGSAVESQTTSTHGDCSPIIHSVEKLTIICESTNSNEIPVFAGLISTGSHIHETLELFNFIQGNMFNVVFLSLLIDERQAVTFDWIASELGVCEYETGDVFDAYGMKLPTITSANFDKYIGFPADVDAWHGKSPDEQWIEFHQQIDEAERCSWEALSIQTNRKRRWDDNGWAVAGFFLVTDTGGHLTRPIISLEEREGTSSEWQAARLLIEKAKEARWARYSVWETRISK